MKGKRLIVIFIVLSLNGCINNRIDLRQTEAVLVKEHTPANLDLSTDVFSDNGNLVILGRMSRGPLEKSRIPGHVDIVILNPKGEEISSIKATFRKLPTWRHGPSPVAFRAEFPGTPPEHSVVEVTYHTERHD